MSLPVFAFAVDPNPPTRLPKAAHASDSVFSSVFVLIVALPPVLKTTFSPMLILVLPIFVASDNDSPTETPTKEAEPANKSKSEREVALIFRLPVVVMSVFFKT